MKSPPWIDAHCHLSSPKYSESLDVVLQRSQAAGVSRWVQGGIDPEDWNRQKLLKAKYGDKILTSFGLHPWWVGTASVSALDSALKTLDQLLPEANALGELGLDFGKSHDLNRSQQERAFEAQLNLGRLHKKPLILHVVKGHVKALEILKKFAPFPYGGIVHSFTGSFEVAQSYIALGFHISIGGAVTQDGYFALKKAIPLLPLNKIVIETDSPDQTPRLEGVEPTQNNEPQFLVGIAKTIAQIKGCEFEEVLSKSTKNLEDLFRMSRHGK